MWRCEMVSRAIMFALFLMSGVDAALAPGKYTFSVVGRENCGSYQGSLSAAACTAANDAVTIWDANTGEGLQEWAVHPVRAGRKIIEGVPVTLQVGGRGGCGAFATYGSCTSYVILKPRLTTAAGSKRQQWVVRRQGDSSNYIIQPLGCPLKALSFKNACNSVGAKLLSTDVGASLWTVSPLADLPEPSPSPPPPSPPSPPPPPSPGLAALSPAPSPSPAAPNVTITAAKLSDWGSGYEGVIRIANNNLYDILNWEVTFQFNESFTWISDVDWTRVGDQVAMKPKEWTKRIKAGLVFDIRFGGRSTLPYSFAFTQILPLLDPDHDISLTTRGEFPAKLFSPYIDALAWPTPELEPFVNVTGQLFYTLAFITARQDKPAWGGVIDLADQYFYDQIRQLRLRGGDVIISFGGANGVELAQAVTDVDSLAAAYQSVVDLYKLRWVDFDIEGGAVADKASVDRRNKAIRKLQDRNPGLTVSYCLPVLPAGLTYDGVALLANAVKNGVRVDVVKVMAMDYGDSAAPDPAGRMGAYAIQAAQNTNAQASSVGLNSTKIGIIPMIGVNDVLSEVFTLADACQVVDFASRTPWVRSTSFWSVGRDSFDSKALGQANPTSSGIPQAPLDFTKLFHSMACEVPATTTRVAALPPPPVVNATNAMRSLPKPAFDHNWESWSQRYPGLGL